MSSVGEELRRERELRGISLEEIADETKIAIRFLQAIDADQLEIIPGEFYRRASLRAYAEHLGLDADRIVATHQFRSALSPSVQVPLPEGSSTAGGMLSRRATKWAALVIVALGMSGAAVAVWPGGDRQEAPVSISPAARPSVGGLEIDEHAGNVPTGTVRRNRTATDPVVREVMEDELTEGLPLRLLFKVDDSCWLEIHADESLVAKGLMHQGFEKEVQAAEEIRLWLGNAGGISVWINDRPAKPFGRAGQVRKDLRITVENLEQFLVPEEEADAATVPTGVR